MTIPGLPTTQDPVTGRVFRDTQTGLTKTVQSGYEPDPPDRDPVTQPHTAYMDELSSADIYKPPPQPAQPYTDIDKGLMG